MTIRAVAPGRVNLIGDHTDYAGGRALPMAIDLRTVVTGERRGDRLVLRSDAEDAPVDLSLDAEPADAAGWGRYVAAVARAVDAPGGFSGQVTSTVPPGSGLSSSAALEVALALAFGFSGPPLALAERCQAAEHAATGVPSGIMDQLCIAAAVADHALLIDFATLTWSPVPVPRNAAIVVVHSGQSRTLDASAYGRRRAELESGDPRRARHVESENVRVDAFADALRAGDLRAAGDLMVESHRSLRDDYEVSTPSLDALVDRLVARPGVHGARLTGAGFGGCVVALTDPGVLDEGWTVRPAGAASVSVV